ncbi:MAG TPA: hypothetical protein VND70_05815 [Acidimicrobiales bacterium]|nr:hypothetical protein [Acidimicrobiales bacterium]
MAEAPAAPNRFLRFWPLLALLAVQALIIAIAPSTAPTSVLGGGAAGNTGSTATVSGASGAITATTAAGAAAASTGKAGGTGTFTRAAAGPAAQSAAAAAAAGAAAAAAAAGSTAHCVGGREFAASLVFYAPPCTPGTIGAPYPGNGGATYQGVTGNTITVVDYYSNLGPEVNAIDQAQGGYVPYSGEQLWDSAMASFINSHYVLFGRTLKIITYQGQCQSVPPDTTCLTAEMDSIIQTYQPYIVLWVNNTLCSVCYAEIAKDHTIGMGGIGFSDNLSNELAPYFYSADQSSTRIETAFAQWWCAQMSSVNVPSRKVAFAGTENSAQNFNGQARRLGVISTNDPDNENTVTQVLANALASDCGDKIWHTYFYSQNINTAAQQVSAGLAAMDTPTDPANAVLCLCDSVAPQFLFEGASGDNYWPEILMANNQLMDQDNTGQNYETAPSCPSSKNCEFSNAVGISPIEAQPPQGTGPAAAVWAQQGQKASLAANLGSDSNADSFLQQFLMMANLIENAGPDLTPANMQARAPSLGAVGGGTTGHQLLGFASGDWHWSQDDRVVYWDENAVSKYNNVNGTFCQIEGSRFNLGQFPSLASGPPVPAVRPSTC